MKRLVRSMKRSLAFLLAAAMVFTMMPQAGMTAEASAYRTESAPDGRIAQETESAGDVGFANEEGAGNEKEPGEDPTADEGTKTDAENETGSKADPVEGDETGNETTPGEGDETGGETTPGEGDETGGETTPGEGDETGGGTTPGEGAETGGETTPGEGDATGGETTPGEGDGTDGETTPGEGDETGGGTTPGEGDESDGETDDELNPDGEDGTASEDETGDDQPDGEDEETETEEGTLSAFESARAGVSDFTIDDKGTLTAYNGAGGDVTIPDTVTAIGKNVFKGKTNITSVTIPGTVLSIGEGAFSGCTGMVKVTLNEGLQTIGGAAFEGAAFGKKELTSITNGTLTIPGSVTSIGGAAFRNSLYLEEVTFQSGQTVLSMSSDYNYSGDAGAFKNCKSLKKVTLPDHLKTLPRSTFEGCNILESVHFGSLLETIERGAFSGCSSLKGVSMPASLRTIGESAFSGCAGLEEVTLNEGLETIERAAFYGAAFGKKELTSITNGTLTIPGSVTSIGGAAFRNSLYLEEVTFQSGQTVLSMSSDFNYNGNEGAFRNCQSLKKVTLPDNLKTLPRSTFEGCSILESVHFGTLLETIGREAFSGCSSLKRASMPASLRTIEESAFSGCSGLEEVTLNEGLETIERAAFYGAAFGKKELSSITNGTLTIPGSVTSIGGAAFRNSAYLETVTFENGTTELAMNSDFNYNGNEGAFRDCQSLKQVTLPDNLKTLPRSTFEGCSILESVHFGSLLETIGREAFRGCSSLKGASMPASLRKIEESAFSGCSGLEEVTLNEGLETIERAAFYGAAFGKKELTGITNGTLTIPGSVTSIGGAAFRNSAYLETVTFENGTTELAMSSDFNYNGNEGPFRDCQSLKQVTLPDNLKTLPRSTFEGCSILESVHFGSLLETIGRDAFRDCSSLKSASMPASLRKIEESAFAGCSGLEEVTLNKGLETIERAAFYGAAFGKEELSGVTVNGTLTIPGSVTSIGGAAFRNSAYLETVTFENGTTELTMSSDYNYNGNEGAFRNCQSLKQVTLPDNLKTLPRSTFEGCSILESVHFGTLLETIGRDAFRDCSSLKGASMPASLRTIGESAFAGCAGLEEVTLNEGLETIERAAFYGAAFGKEELSGVTVNGSLTIPGSVTSIGGAAFRNSAYLEMVTFENGTTELIMSSDYNYNGNEGVFRNCQSLKQVTLPDHLKTLPRSTFEGCSILESVHFGSLLEKIGRGAFIGCSSLQGVYLPESLTTIETEAFLNCGMLETLYIPKKVTVIGDNILNLKTSPKAVIYGVRGSEAENYANKNKIPFREEGELVRSVTGISLNRSRVTVAGEEAIGSTILLRATVRPSTAQNRKVDFISDNKDVATVDAQGKITIQGYGTATVTAVAKDESNGRKTASCQVIVLRKWNEEEKEMICRKLQEFNAAKLSVVTNVCETVEDVPIDCPAELGLQSVEWRLPYSISAGEETYDIVVKKDGYQDAVINGITITGMTVEGVAVSGASKLQSGKSTLLSAEVLTSGGELSPDAYVMRWETPVGSGVSLTNAEQNPVTVTGTANKTATVTGYLLLKKDGRPVARDSALKNRQWFSASAKITVTGDAVADRIEIDVKGQDGLKVELSSLRELTEAKEYQLSAKAYAGEALLPAPVLQWKSTNSAVAEVRAQGETATLRIKEKGAAVISVSASKNGGYTESFRVVMKDSTPRLEETGITLNLNQVQPSAVVHISPSNGYAVAEEGLAVKGTDGGVSDFTIRRIEGTEYRIGIQDGRNPSGTYKVFLEMRTSAGEETAHRLPLNITVSRQLPKVTVTQENLFNLYEKGEESRIILKADAEIAEIRYTPSGSGPRLVLKESHPEEGYFTVQAEGQTSGNYKNTSVKGNLQITFTGYRADAAYNKALTVKANKKLPAVQAVPESTVLYPEYPETGLDTTAVSFRLKADQQDITAEAGWHMTLSGSAPTGVTVQPASEGQPITATFSKAAKNSVSLKFVVRNDNWVDQSGVKASCTIKKGQTPEMGFSNNKLILNKAYGLDEYEPVEIGLFVKNQPERRIADISSIVGKDAKAEKVKNTGFNFTFEEGSLKAGIRDKSIFPATNTKYTYLVKGVDERGIPVSGSLNVTVSAAAAKVTLKQSGSIDLLNREGTQILCKPALKNYMDTIERVDLYGSYASSFSAVMEDGNIVIRAREGKALKIKTTYKLFLRIRLASGAVLTGEAKVTPKQNNPKLTVNTKKIVLFEASSGEAYGKRIVATPVKEGGPEIDKIELTNGGDTFGYTDEGDGYGTLYVLDTASQKVNKTYKLKLAVRFKGGAANAAPVYVTVSVNYKK